MITLQKIQEFDQSISPEHILTNEEKLFYYSLVDAFYSNPICFAGIFTGNDLDSFHDLCSSKNYNCDAYDCYPFLEEDNKLVFQDYVTSKHSDKDYVTFHWSDVSSSNNQYSVIYNTAGYKCPIHNLFSKQKSPCILLNSRGSSWGIFKQDFNYIFRSNHFDIFVNNDEARSIFISFLKQNMIKFTQLGFDIVKIDDNLFGYLRKTSNYKKFVTSFSDVSSFSV
jgi:hypothetical protein